MYSARITRINPTAFIMLIDQSGSMEEHIVFNNERMSKANAVAIVTNMLLGELVNRSRRDEQLRDYFEIAAIGYCDDLATSLLSPEGTFTRPSELASTNYTVRTLMKERVLPNGTNIVSTTNHRTWIEPKANGNTPMHTALVRAYELAQGWCNSATNRKSYPLTIFNITDGEASDADEKALIEITDKIKRLSTEDGNVLIMNIHISATQSDSPVLFPSSPDELPQWRYARMLYAMSSTMPERYNADILSIRDVKARPPFRGMGFNTSTTEIISMMNIGSISVNLMQ